MLGYVEHQAHAGHIHYQVGSTVADERKRDSRDGHDADAHADVFIHVENQHGHHADDDELTEFIVGVKCQNQHAVDDERIERQKHQRAEKPQRFADNRENKVGVIFGHIVEVGQRAFRPCALAI